MPHQHVTENVYRVGGEGLSAEGDCCVYYIHDEAPILVDAGLDGRAVAENLGEAGFPPEGISQLFLTHCHIDHIGGATHLVDRSGALVVMQELDAVYVEHGDLAVTAASWYGIERLEGLAVQVRFGAEMEIDCGRGRLKLLHTPGHTPGSAAGIYEIGGKRILFGQDIHGPFDPSFKSDVAAWRSSMEGLLAQDFDTLCEGHYGVIAGAQSIKRFIRSFF